MVGGLLFPLVDLGEFPVSAERPEAGSGEPQQSHRAAQEGPLRHDGCAGTHFVKYVTDVLKLFI